MSNIYQNDRDPGYNAQNGMSAEAAFELAARAAGWDVKPAPPIQDYECHIDFVITWVGDPAVNNGKVVRDGAEFTVDVKSDSMADTVWIEIRNIHGDAGWLYGDADFIAFRREKGFLLVDRVKLRDWINENVEKVYVTNKRDALMKVYTRNGRKDMITKVQNYHLVALAQQSGGVIKYG